MSLEFSRRKSPEGLNDHDEHLDGETNERAWNSLKTTSPFNPDAASKRIEESKHQTLELLKSIAGTTNPNGGKARQDVLNSYKHKEPQEITESLQEADTIPYSEDYGKSGVGSFAELMMQRDREYGQQKQDDIKAPKSSGNTPKNDITKDKQTSIETKSVLISSREQLPSLDLLKTENEREWFRVANVPTSIFMSERSDVIPPPDDPNKYLFTDQDGNNLFAHLANMGVGMSEDSRSHKAFGWRMAHLDFNTCIKDGTHGSKEKVFDFDINAFFQKNKHGVSAVDILIQSGNLDGLKALNAIGNLMQSNRLLQPQTRETQSWDESIGRHRSRKETYTINTSLYGDELLQKLHSSIISSLDIVPSEIAEKLQQFIQEKMPE